MKITNSKNIISKVVLMLFVLIFNTTAAAETPTVDSLSNAAREMHPKKKISEYYKEYPWIGLITDEITYGPVTVSHIHINKGDKLTVVKPGETLHGFLKYKLDTADQDKFHRCHLVIGINNVGAQDCIAHTFNLWESKGIGKFELKAPEHPGVYEVRIAFIDSATCQKAHELWNVGECEPSAAATIGVIVVE